MSYSLICNVETQAKRTAGAWWISLAECLRQQGFLYSQPTHPDGESWFFWSHFPKPDSGGEHETGLLWGSFSLLLEKATDLEHRTNGDEYSGIVAAFRAVDDEEFYLEPQIALDHSGTYSLILTMDSANVAHVPLDQARARVIRMIACTQSVWEMSQPTSGEMFWGPENLNIPCVIFGTLPGFVEKETTACGGEPLNYVQMPDVSGNSIFVADPFPVKRSSAAGWAFISLRIKE